MSWVLVGPTTWYSSVPTIHQLSLISAVLSSRRCTYLTVLWGWQSDTAVMVGFTVLVDVGAGVTVCATAHAAKSRTAMSLTRAMFWVIC
jgi:hypothetical protein